MKRRDAYELNCGTEEADISDCMYITHIGACLKGEGVDGKCER